MNKIIYFFFLFISLTVFSQNESLNISLNVPANWYNGDKKLLKDNLLNFKFNNNDLNNLKKQINQENYIKVFYKYNPDTHFGLVPTIKVYLRNNPTGTFNDFFEFNKNEIEKVIPHVLNFKYIENPQRIILKDNKEAFYAVATYNLNLQDGDLGEVRTIFVAIPIGEEYLYATFIDNSQEDSTEEYRKILDSISIQN